MTTVARMMETVRIQVLTDVKTGKLLNARGVDADGKVLWQQTDADRVRTQSAWYTVWGSIL